MLEEMKETIRNMSLSEITRFRDKYGYVSDREIAKELLCVSSNAWYVLDESLKEDNEIIMYYQPMGIIEYTIYDPVAGGYYGTSIQCSYSRMGEYSDIQIPNIVFPKDFDINTYVAIQQELMKNYEFTYQRNNLEFYEVEEPDNPLDSDDPISISFKLYNRDRLKDIVNNITNPHKM